MAIMSGKPAAGFDKTSMTFAQSRQGLEGTSMRESDDLGTSLQRAARTYALLWLL
jgi:hypothetical protein